MPKKARISLTFDDGLLTTYTNAFPILKQNGLVGNLAVVTDRVGKEGQYSWDQIKEMVDAGWEVCSHTRNHDLWNMQDEKIDKEVVEAKKILTDKGYPPKVFIAPGGPWQEEQPEMLAKGSAFDKAVRETYHAYMSGGHADAIKLPVNPHEFGRFGCECYDMDQYNASLKDIRAAIDKAVAEGDWCHLGWHNIEGRHVATFKATVAHVRGYLAAGKMAASTISQALGIY